MSKLEEQKALPRRKLFKLGKKRLARIIDMVVQTGELTKDSPEPKRKAKKAKRKP